MKKKKGFMFVETIMVMTILTTTLLSIYITFSRVLLNEKRRAMFDDTSYLYRTYLIEDYLASLDISKYIKNTLVDANRKIVKLNAKDGSLYNTTDLSDEHSLERSKELFSEKVLQTESGQNILSISNIYITYYNVNDLKACINKSGRMTCNGNASMEDLNNISNINAYLYIRSLSGTGDGYRLIVEYQDDYIDYTKSKNPQNDGTCSNNFVLKNNKCYRKVRKSYFNSVKLYTEDLK